METKVVLAIIISFLVSVILCPIVIPLLKKLKFGQYIREEGPESHKSKAGTPTMGGMIILTSIIITSLIFIKDYPKIIPILFVTIGFGIVGFLDDYIKVVMKRNLGLKAWQKMLGQFIIATIFIIYIVKYSGFGTTMTIPFTDGMVVDIGWLFIPLSYLVILGTVNGANLTDGLDGLATSVTLIMAVFFTVVAVATGSDLEPVMGATAGALLGFFLFNVYPARVFMGDTGSLALGGFVAASAYMLNMPLIIVIVGFIYFVETLSVMLQVAYFKLTHGKRLFKMAPIHHHFEKCGYAETQIVTGFAVVTTICCLIAYMAV